MALANRFVFIAGLHRTGTSLLGRIVGSHPEVSSIHGSPVPENEGCYLQGAIPHTAMDGRPGHYALDPSQHHTETSVHNRLETKKRLLSDWEPWFDPAMPWWLEKSPINLTRMRLYQQLLPTCQFIVIVRHPQFMAAALEKWTNDGRRKLVSYGLDAYDIMRADLPYLHSAMVIRYEDLVAEFSAIRKAMFAFLSLDDHDSGLELRDGNMDYLVEDIDAGLGERMGEWGYEPNGKWAAWNTVFKHPLRSTQEAISAALSAINTAD